MGWMGLGFSRCCVIAAVVSACAVLSAPALASSTPIGLTASARSDHLVELTWSWPANPTYPDELDVRRDGLFVTTVSPVSATSFADTVANPGTTHTYELVPVDGGVLGTPTAPTAPVTLRADLPNKPTDVAATFLPNTNNIAQVTWTRGAQDADVTYTVTAQQGSGPVNTRTVKYADDGTQGSLTMDVFASYTTYVFKVSAVEDVDPPDDPGGTVTADASATATSYDVIPPQLSGTATAARSSLGTVDVSWPAASDAGSGVASYTVCVDTTTCTSVPFQPLDPSQSAQVTGIRNDGGPHAVSVTAIDQGGNPSTPLAAQVTMPLPATPVIALDQGGNGCAPLIATATPSDTGVPAPAIHLFVDGSVTETPLGQEITGAPYQAVSLVAQATWGLDSSLPSSPLIAHVFDPDGPDVSPVVHGQPVLATNTEILSWDPVTAAGAPIVGYLVTSTTIPGYETGRLVTQPSVTFSGLTPTESYIVQVTAVDACGRQSPLLPSPPRFRLDDRTGPSAPVLNVPTTTGSSVRLTWAPSTDNVGVDVYKVFQNGAFLDSTPNTFYDVTGLPDYWTASYTVVASDFAGNSSVPSNTRSATTKDMTPPGPPGAPTARNQDGSFTLTWSAASDNSGVVVGYQVSRDNLIQNVAGTTFVDRNVPVGKHTWAVRAFDAAGLFSLPRSVTAESSGTPKATIASAPKGAKVLRVGGKSGARVVLTFKITQSFQSAVLRLNVLKSTPKVRVKGSGSLKSRVTARVKLRVALPARTGRTQAGKRLAERAVRRGTIQIPLGPQKVGVLRLVVTASGGSLTLAGTGAKKAPTIQPANS
jgi:hypothetical protein